MHWLWDASITDYGDRDDDDEVFGVQKESKI